MIFFLSPFVSVESTRPKVNDRQILFLSPAYMKILLQQIWEESECASQAENWSECGQRKTPVMSVFVSESEVELFLSTFHVLYPQWYDHTYVYFQTIHSSSLDSFDLFFLFSVLSTKASYCDLKSTWTDVFLSANQEILTKTYLDNKTALKNIKEN